jgi:capsular polysaccharide transport system permease protein
MMNNGLSVMRTVVHALLLRELKTRFGEYRLGYLWALLEPLAHLSMLLLIFGVLMRRVMPDISFPVFLVNGIVPYLMFSSICSRALNAVEANRGLFSYRPVRPVDAVLARALLEMLVYGSVYLLLMTVLYGVDEPIRLDNLLQLSASWLLLWLLSLGCALVFMVAGHAVKSADKVLPLLMKPLYFISGVMFSIHVVPSEYRWMLDWNPLLHAFELMRHAVCPSYPLYDISLGYLACWTLALLCLGLALYKGREPAMLRS